MVEERFTVQIEKNNKSACIFDAECIDVYMLVKFGIFDSKKVKKEFIDELYRLCNLLNELNERRIKL